MNASWNNFVVSDCVRKYRLNLLKKPLKNETNKKLKIAIRLKKNEVNKMRSV